MATTTAMRTDQSPVIERLRHVREAIYQSGEVPAMTGKPHQVWPIGLTRDRGEALRDLIVREGAVTAIETGFAFGMSASWLLEGLLLNGERRGETTNVRLTSVDPFATRAWRDAGVRHLNDAGVSDHHELHREGSELVLPRLVAEGRRFDVVFVDGDHRFEYVFTDVLYARRLVRQRGLIVVDDAWMPSVRKCTAFFESAGLVDVEISAADSPLAKYHLLRVNNGGDGRAWDHFADF